MGEVSNGVSLDVVTALMPKPASATPKNEMTGGATGTASTKFALEDHAHPRLTSTTYATLDANGEASVTFTRTFLNKPGFSITEIDSVGNQPLVPVVKSLTQVNGVYTGCVIKCYRSTLLPMLTPLSTGLTLLTQVITGVNSINTALSNLNLFGGSANGASVSVVAIARSDVPPT